MLMVAGSARKVAFNQERSPLSRWPENIASPGTGYLHSTSVAKRRMQRDFPDRKEPV